MPLVDERFMLPHALITALLLQPQPATVVTPGTSDASPLGAPLRLEAVSLQVESDFSKVYELTPTPGLFGRPATRRFARRAGAVTAIFPRSSYAASKTGPVAMIPNDTVFMIGEMNEPEPAPGRTEPMPLAADLSAAALAYEAPAPKAHTPAPPTDRRISIWTDAAYREHRLNTILDDVSRR